MKTPICTSDLDEFIGEVVGGLQRGLDPDSIYLFGSHVRGEATADSDVDFLVVIPDSDLPRHRRAQMARAMAPSTQFAKDIIVLTREEWDRGSRVPVSLVSTVKREGKLLHARR